MTRTKDSEYSAFNDLASKILSVSHREVKAKLDAEKQAKKRKKAKTSASGHAAGAKN
jgi:hypothetical protein